MRVLESTEPTALPTFALLGDSFQQFWYIYVNLLSESHNIYYCAVVLIGALSVLPVRPVRALNSKTKTFRETKLGVVNVSWAGVRHAQLYFRPLVGYLIVSNLSMVGVEYSNCIGLQ